MNFLRYIIQKRRFKAGPMYLFPAAFLFIVGLTGFMYGAPLLYWPPALVCMSLTFYPTLLAWGLILSVFLIGSGIYLYALIHDALIHNVTGIYSDSFIGPLFALIVFGLNLFVALTFPQKIKNESEP